MSLGHDHVKMDDEVTKVIFQNVYLIVFVVKVKQKEL